MRKMTVEHLGGTEEVADLASLDNLMRDRDVGGLNEFWIFGETKHPVLAVSVRGDMAALHYFPYDGHPGFQSRGVRDPGDTFTFRTTNGEAIYILSEAIVSLEEAQRATHEFVESLALPESLQWFEL